MNFNYNDFAKDKRWCDLNEWISANDKVKPKDGEKVLAYFKRPYGGFYMLVKFSENLYDVDAFYFRNKRHPGFYSYDGESGYYEVSSVTHWMSLPEEPEEE